MKIEINIIMESKDERTVAEMEELVNYIESGGLQRDLSKDSTIDKYKRARVKATVTKSH